MGRPKALLFLRQICATLREGGADPLLVVVAAPHGEAVARMAASSGAQVVWNRHPEQGQVSSMALGLETLQGHPFALLALVDHPDVSAATVRALLEAAARDPYLVLVPVFHGERGHPVVLPTAAAPLLRASPSAREAMTQLEVRELPVDDPGILLDIDTPEGLSRWTETR
jgi:molybdenum cofactor cytidylyltransferase